MENKIINFTDVSLNYEIFDGNLKIFDKISFSIAEGELIGIYGPSGSGKTSLLNLISKTLIPTEGDIKINANTLLIDQSVILNPYLTCYETIDMWISILQSKESINTVLDKVNLLEKQNQYVHALSGGEIQRMFLARALLSDMKILLLDEPFSNLDTKNAKKIQEELLNIVQLNNLTLILVSHYLAHFANFNYILEIKYKKLIKSTKSHSVKEIIISTLNPTNLD